MPKPASSSCDTTATPAIKPAQLDFLLTTQQGDAARTLLSYVCSLPLTRPDAQLLGVIVAIRAARGGVGNLTGVDLSALRLGHPRDAVEALQNIGWELTDTLLDGDPETPVAVTVPDLAGEADRRLPFGKLMRSRVSGWTTRTLAAKPVKKTAPATRLAALFLAAHSSSKLHGDIPRDLPEACRTALPELLHKGFLADLADDHYQLDPAVRHLSGMRPHVGCACTVVDHADSDSPAAPKTPSATALKFSAAEWAQWKDKASTTLRRHVEAVEHCSLCAMPAEQVACAFMNPRVGLPVQKSARNAYGAWKGAHPDRGPLAAQFTVAFRTEHGHGPSYSQLCAGLGWDLRRQLRSFVVHRLLVNEWLTETAPVPWTLRPGRAAQAHGISLPGQRPVAIG